MSGLLAVLLAVVPVTVPQRGVVAEPSAPFAMVQYGTDGCIEVGVRPDSPYNQPRPFIDPAGADLSGGYPAYGYDPSGLTPTSGTNACRYKFFREYPPADLTKPDATAYCVQWAAGQRSTTGYDPEPADGRIANDGYVRRIIADNWPAADQPVVPAQLVAKPVAKTVNAQRSGAVAMAIHYFTDGVVMPPNYQTPALYEAVKTVVDRALAAGPLDAPADPTPTIDGPNGGRAGELIGPYTLGANATGNVTVTVTGAEAFTDAAGTTPFTSGGTIPAGGMLWLRAVGAGEAVIKVSGQVSAGPGTRMDPDPAHKVQSMEITQPTDMTGKSSKKVAITATDPPRVTSRASSTFLETGQGVTDTLFVSGLTGRGTLTATLFGPVPTVGGGCSAVAWDDVAALPVRREYDPVDVSGDTTVTTPQEMIDRSGCYSFGVVLDPAAGDSVTVAPGDAAETFHAVPKVVPPPYLVSTRVSARKIAVRGSIVDHITIRGLLPGRSLTVTPTLYGPLVPRDGSCAGIDWRAPGLPIAARFTPITVSGDTTVSTPARRLTRAGCYGFDAVTTTTQLTGGLVPVGHGLGLPAETVQVVPQPKLKIVKRLRPAWPRMGKTARYTVTITNPGDVTRAHSTVRDDLSGVLDDGSYRRDAKATSGRITYRRPVLSWTGDLRPGQTVTLTYSFTLNRSGGDHRLVNKVIGPRASTCPAHGHRGRACGRSVPIVPGAEKPPLF
ncbi:hypothetical protein [Spirillospora sp. NPDC047279]|uniref:DUF7927 domain-containing protein n=1 Tax=Spirillospora sp. NPDC047279 TaxID=3155478 RepID=UPI0033C3AA0C